MAEDVEVFRFQQHLTRNGCEVSRPSLPFVLEGPDLLVRNGVRAAMVFFPHPNERRSPSLLAGRISGALLAYPSHVFPIAAFSIIREAEAMALLNNRLSIATSPDELLKLVVHGSQRTAWGNEELRRIKQLHVRRYSRMVAAADGATGRQVTAVAPNGQFKLSLKLRKMRKGDKAIFGVRATQTDAGLLLSAVSPGAFRRASAELTQSNLGTLYKLDAAVPHPTTSVVDKGFIADQWIGAGREDALWFALIHTTFRGAL